MPNSCQCLRWTLICLALCLVNSRRCKVPYEKVEEHYCYYIADDMPETAFSNFCYQDKRTSRVCLDSDKEMRTLANFLYASGYDNGTEFWSAGHRWAGDLQFYWNYFGHARRMNYTNWQLGEPTPRMGRNCLLLTLQAGELIMS
ncbi:CG13086, partial [Drosophila busckii]